MPDVDEWTLFFKIVGAMPLEFFSFKTVEDNEAHSICKSLGIMAQKIICEYLNTLFCVKVLSENMPRFGKDTELVLLGICKLMVI